MDFEKRETLHIAYTTKTYRFPPNTKRHTFFFGSFTKWLQARETNAKPSIMERIVLFNIIYWFLVFYLN